VRVHSNELGSSSSFPAEYSDEAPTEWFHPKVAAMALFGYCLKQVREGERSNVNPRYLQ